ncbi:MAG: hypothetical protein LBU43_11680 [Candidatus Accumulibacter sp.]|jgi:hypothetical protein|nr:hypothetical protein [Accumulibacter sp.]
MTRKVEHIPMMARPSSPTRAGKQRYLAARGAGGWGVRQFRLQHKPGAQRFLQETKRYFHKCEDYLLYSGTYLALNHRKTMPVLEISLF